jgi:uncharacterized heparinase superfamily protein
MNRARWLRTVRHLRPAQVVGQLVRPLRPRGRPCRARRPVPPVPPLSPTTAFLPVPEHARESRADRVRLLGRELAGVDWRHAGHGRLFEFHLQYGDWLRADGLAPAERAALLRDWMGRETAGVGWHPAVISERVFAWAKLLATPGALPDDGALREALSASLADQVATLAANLERDLLANHLLFNRLALALGGVLLDGPDAEAWRSAERALRAELAEQVGADGAHYERSPMYHALALERVLDLLNLAAARPARVASALEAELRAHASRMLGALAVWTHPDGQIALVGDAAFGLTPAPAELAAYAARLGLAAAGPPVAGVLDGAGFVRLAAGRWSLLASVAGPRPAYQPGHAHCDALAFELCVGGERLVTDTGVCEYVPGPRRDASRATRSHATLAVGGNEQAEIWSAHRVGGRPRVELRGVQPGRAAEASCAGWATPDVVHLRRFEVSEAAVRIVDRVEGSAKAVEASLPLAPDVEPSLDGRRASLRLPSGARIALLLPEGLAWSVEPGPYFPAFGRELERPVLRGRASAWRGGEWTFRAEGPEPA